MGTARGKAGAFFSARGIRVDINIFHLGFGVFLALNMLFFWRTLPFTSGNWQAGVSEAYLGTYRYASAFSIAIFAFLDILLERRHRTISSSRMVTPLLTITFFVGAMLVGYGSSQLQPTAAFLVAGLLMGFSNAGFFLLWGKILASGAPDLSRSELFFSSVVAAIGYLLVVLSPNMAVTYLVIGILLPIMVLALMRSDQELSTRLVVSRTSELASSDKPGKFSVAWKSLWVPIFCNSALGFSFNLIREISFTAVDRSPLINLLSTVSLLLAVIIFLFLGRKLIEDFYARRFYPVMFLALSACLFLMPFLDTNYQVVLMTLVSGTYLFVDFLIKTLSLQISYRNRIDAFLTFGLSHAILFLMLACGTLFGSLLKDNGSYGFAQLVVAAFVCTYLLAIPLMGGSRQSKKVVITSLDEAGRARRCAELGQMYQLTPKETEVMDLMVQGLSFSEMAAHLVVSENTVRTHAKSIYRKLGIHSKPELRKMIGSVRMD